MAPTRDAAMLSAPCVLLGDEMPRVTESKESPLEDEDIAPFFFNVETTQHSSTSILKPHSHTATKQSDAPPTHFLATGIPFIEIMSFHPSRFVTTLYDKPAFFRILLVGGTRIPRSYKWCRHEERGSAAWSVDEAEVNKEGVERFSRILQLWKIGVPNAPGKGSVNDPGYTEPPFTIELTLPCNEAWGVTDAQWYGKQDEAIHAMLSGHFRHTIPSKGRLGYIAVTTTKGHVAIYAVPVMQKKVRHCKLEPCVWTQSPGVIYTTVEWHVTRGEVRLFAGMANGDVAYLLLVKNDTKLTLHVCKQLKTAAANLIKQVVTMNTWTARVDMGMDPHSSDSCMDQQDRMPPVQWSKAADTTIPMTGRLPKVAGVEIDELIVSLGVQDKALSVWPTRQLDISTGHYGAIGVRHKFLPSCVHPLPWGALLVGLEDSTIVVASPPCDMTLPLWNLRCSTEVQNSVTSMAHVTCGRRTSDDTGKTNIRASGKRPPRTDVLLATGSGSGLFSILRVPKRILSPDQGARTCSVCRKAGYKNSWTLSSCHCILKSGLTSCVVDVAVALVSGVQWVLPQKKTDTPTVKVSVITDPTAAQTTEHRNAASTVGNILRTHNHLVDFAPGEKRAHLLAMSCQGGLITVLPV
eukprot:TRINITY_DN6651_c0_g3_i3.p1 TRINITY_DN6651_c0_g3~~TRINITY_DN6651_c0_g3_i3.p1  ORF type:complete len:702 (+),score=135.54 TRINITY_DN6651_c0_g3_i3:203-2107(+)